MITKFTNYIVESRKSVDELEMLNPEELGELLRSEVWKNPVDFQHIQNLLDVGCPIDARDQYGRTALHLAAGGTVALDSKLNLVKFLVSKGAEVNARDIEGRTPLHAASYLGQTNTFKFLVSVGGDINAKNHNGETPLHLAVFDKYYSIVAFLLSIGAQVDVQDVLDLTPWDYASEEMEDQFPKLNPYK